MDKIYILSSVLMAALFVGSASVQFNDKDWYFWVPLYACAAYVNLINCCPSLPLKGVKFTGKMTSILSQYLLANKVFLNDNLGGLAGFLSLDMKEKLVREKIGAVLVMLCMILQISASELFHKDPSKRKNLEVGPSVRYEMAILAAISYGFSIFFLVYHVDEMKL